MKNIFILILLPFFLILFSCDSDDDSPNCQGIDCLPEATQSGAGTFGCLVNGEPFYAFGGVTCYYQLIDGEYYFAVGFAREVGSPRSIVVESTKFSINEGSFQLLESGENKIYAFIRIENNESTSIFYTTESYSGQLNIIKFDQENQIISGTFEFEIFNPDDGQVYQITDGRFDSFYTQ